MTRQFFLGLAVCLCFSCSGLHAESAFFDSKGVKIHYAIEGKGVPVLLIHGFAVNVQVQWEAPGVIKALTKDYQVIALDVRGHGRSDKPHEADKYGLEMVEDAVRLLDHLKIDKAHVVGYSMGSAITLKLVVTHPERVLSATLGGMGLQQPGVEPALRAVVESLEMGKGLEPLIIWLNPLGQPKPTAAQVGVINSFLLSINDPKALAAVMRSANDKSLTMSEQKLKAIAVPMLVIIGGQDPLKKGVPELKRLVPHLEVVEIPGADHISTFLNPTFLKSLTRFLSRDRNKTVPEEK